MVFPNDVCSQALLQLMLTVCFYVSVLLALVLQVNVRLREIQFTAVVNLP